MLLLAQSSSSVSMIISNLNLFHHDYSFIIMKEPLKAILNMIPAP
ncbi:hypothetical protein AF72_11290 [Xylella taiwanensis]|uniref:Uncharacterized protein n=1 Tax=Xylella taiwanensis TaxID=1444770 RepID=Z9JGM8_9GAMM|nr:hypothetical protein AF72_11290 [Xylella taiwanensis]